MGRGYWRQSTGGGFVLSGGGFVSLAAIADAEKGRSRQHQKQWENIRCLIISPVNIQTILLLTLHFQHSSYHFIVIE